MGQDTFIIAKEGWKYSAGALLLFVLFVIIDADFLQFASLGAAAAALWIYRNPERSMPYFQNKSITSVSDGTVTAIESVDMEEGGESCFKVSVRSAYRDVSVLRVPFESSVTSLQVRRGARLSGITPLAEVLNEKALIRLTDSDDNSIRIEHLLEQSVDDLSVRMESGQQFQQGARYGLMTKGMTTFYLPGNVRIAVKTGDKVRAGETLIGYFS
jgi:phosphatidylserine decarboxylase